MRVYRNVVESNLDFHSRVFANYLNHYVLVVLPLGNCEEIGVSDGGQKSSALRNFTEVDRLMPISQIKVHEKPTYDPHRTKTSLSVEVSELSHLQMVMHVSFREGGLRSTVKVLHYGISKDIDSGDRAEKEHSLETGEVVTSVVMA